MMASKDPGQLGCYGFRNRKDHSYDGYAFANSTQVKEPRLWDLLGAAGKRSIVLGVPQTYPPRPIVGEMVTCFLTPSTKAQYTYPESLKAEVERVGRRLRARRRRLPDRRQGRRCSSGSTPRRASTGRSRVTSPRPSPWDFFMLVEMGLDRIHHGFWSYMDPEHHKYEPGNPFEQAIRDYYRHLDGELDGAARSRAARHASCSSSPTTARSAWTAASASTSG